MEHSVGLVQKQERVSERPGRGQIGARDNGTPQWAGGREGKSEWVKHSVEASRAYQDGGDGSLPLRVPPEPFGLLKSRPWRSGLFQ